MAKLSTYRERAEGAARGALLPDLSEGQQWLQRAYAADVRELCDRIDAQDREIQALRRHIGHEPSQSRREVWLKYACRADAELRDD